MFPGLFGLIVCLCLCSADNSTSFKEKEMQNDGEQLTLRLVEAIAHMLHRFTSESGNSTSSSGSNGSSVYIVSVTVLVLLFIVECVKLGVIYWKSCQHKE